MIVCSCNVLSSASVAEAARRMALAEPSRPVTAGRVFRALGTRPQCGTCLSVIRQIAAETGAMVTCPEPLAMVSEEEAEITVMETQIVFDVSERVA